MEQVTDFIHGTYHLDLWEDFGDGVSIISSEDRLKLQDSDGLGESGFTKQYTVSQGSAPIQAQLIPDSSAPRQEFQWAVQGTDKDIREGYAVQIDTASNDIFLLKLEGDGVTDFDTVAGYDGSQVTSDTWDVDIQTWDTNGNISVTVSAGDLSHTLSGQDNEYTSGALGISIKSKGAVLYLESIAADSYSDNRLAAPQNVSADKQS